MSTNPAPRSTVDLPLAVFLAQACELTYTQYHHDGAFTPPTGYTLVTPFRCRVFAVDEWFGFVIRSEHTAVVAFRGTQSDLDWIGDGDVLEVPCRVAPDSGRVHDGFLSIYDSCRATVLDAVRGLPSSLQLCVTGHSLGAALATLCALDIASQTGSAPLMYNYGSPRVGDPTFVAAYAKRISTSVRVANVHDIVPKIPPAEVVPTVFPTGLLTPITDIVWRYQHVPHVFTIDAEKGSVAANHAIATYEEALRSLE